MLFVLLYPSSWFLCSACLVFFLIYLFLFLFTYYFLLFFFWKGRGFGGVEGGVKEVREVGKEKKRQREKGGRLSGECEEGR